MTHTLLGKCTMLVSSSLSITEMLLSQASIHFLNRLACSRSQDAGACPSMHWLPVYRRGWHTQTDTFIFTFTPTGNLEWPIQQTWTVGEQEGHANCTQEGPSWSSDSNHRMTVKQATEPSHAASVQPTVEDCQSVCWAASVSK